MKTNKKVIKTIVVLSLFIFILSLLSFAYYTNHNKFFVDSRKNDGYSGFALQRSTNEFIINGSGAGTMLDTVTGLTWDMNMNHNGVLLAWATSNAYAEPTWNKTTKVYSYPSGKANYPAFSYCEDLIQGNYNDYRLPTRDELMTLINETGGTGSTCTTLSIFGFINCQNSNYWTEEEYNSFTTYAWYMNFYYGFDGGGNKVDTIYVVCVRRD